MLWNKVKNIDIYDYRETSKKNMRDLFFPWVFQIEQAPPIEKSRADLTDSTEYERMDEPEYNISSIFGEAHQDSEGVVLGDDKRTALKRVPNIFALVCFDDVRNPSPSRDYLWGNVEMMNEAHGDFTALHRLLFKERHTHTTFQHKILVC